MANPRIDELRKRLEKEPGSRLFAQLAEELRKDGALDEAIRVCRDGLQKQPNYPSARMTLGRALFDSGDLRGARTELESVLKGAPDNLLAGRLLGDCLERQGERAAALARFKMTLALAPGDRQILDRIHALEAGAQPAAAEAATILMAPPVPQPAAPAWSPLPAVPPEIETTLIDVPAPFSPGDAGDPGPEAITPLELEGEGGFEPEPSPRPEPTLVETAPDPGVFAAPPPAAAAFDAPAEMARDFELEQPYESPPTLIGGAPLGAGAEPAPPAAAAVPPAAALPLAEPPSAVPSEAPGEAELNTATLAELYLSQGVTDKAIAVYRQLLERDPQNERARTRLAEVVALDERIRAEEALAAGAGTGDAAATRRAAIERTIAKLEQLMSALRKG